MGNYTYGKSGVKVTSKRRLGGSFRAAPAAKRGAAAKKKAAGQDGE